MNTVRPADAFAPDTGRRTIIQLSTPMHPNLHQQSPRPARDWTPDCRPAHHHLRPGMALLLCSGLLASHAALGDESASKAPFDRAWRHAVLYDNPDSAAGRLALSGRLQLDSVWFSADPDQAQAEDKYNDVLWRRFRFGFKWNFAGNWVAQLEGDFNLNNELSDLYEGLTDAYIGYAPGKAWGVKVLKQSAAFTLDGATSSKELLTPERNNLTNNLWFTEEYFSGASIAGVLDSRWSYKAGLFSSDGDPEIGFTGAAWFTLLSLGYDFGESLDLDLASVRVDYVYNKEDADANTRDFAQVLSLVTEWEKGRLGLWTDLSSGRGYRSQSDVWGLVLMPFYRFNDRHQVVLRYTWVTSADDNGVRFNRYERNIVDDNKAAGIYQNDRGDRYNELLAGYNLFFYGHKLKWQTALQYTTMADSADDGGEYDGWGLTTGLRMSW